MEDSDFVYGFQAFTIAYLDDSFSSSIFEREDDDATPMFYSIEVVDIDTFYAIVDFYPARMYPYSCRQGSSTGVLSVYKNDGTAISLNNQISDSAFSNYAYLQDAEPTTYVFKVDMDSWDSTAVPDYTFRIYSAQAYEITVYDPTAIH